MTQEFYFLLFIFVCMIIVFVCSCFTSHGEVCELITELEDLEEEYEQLLQVLEIEELILGEFPPTEDELKTIKALREGTVRVTLC